ncbi:MAG: tetratricopeptide repeat protein [Verrucomicrobiota bacterium]
MPRVFFLLLALSGLLAGSVHAQFLILKDGSRIPSSEFQVENGKIIRTILLGDNKTAKTELPKQNVGSLDWPEVAEISEARNLMSQGKAEEALAILAKAKTSFEIFETLPGSPYAEIFFTYVELLSQAGKFEDTVKLIPQLKILKLTDSQKMQLRIIQLDIDRQTSSEYTSIIAEAESILSETDDSSVGASIWAMIADIYARQKNWEKALMSYLRIPVFYGTQLQRVPDAELKAGQMLTRMKRFEDAQAVFKRLVETYPGSAVADLAGKDLAKINGMKNEPEGSEAKDDAAKPAEGAAPAEAAAPAAK